MVIKGVIEDIIFRNSENGYTVVALDYNGDYITAVGKFPPVNAGETVELVGVFSSHSKYGEQFTVQSAKISQPTSKDSIVKFLGSGLIKNVGPATAFAIVEKFGESTLDIIEFNPSRLVEVRGISEKKASDIANAYHDLKKMQNAVVFLQQHNISTNMAVKIYNTYGSKTEDVVKQNPYKLIEDIDGVGFFTADKIAQKIGIAPKSEFRVRAGILHILKESGEKNGNTYLPKENLADELIELLQFEVNIESKELFENALSKLVLDSVVKVLNEEDVEVVVMQKIYAMERMVADILCELNLLHNDSFINIENEIQNYENINKIKMHDMQKQAVITAVNSGVSVITGGPGTGKTTIIKCVLQILNGMNKRVKLLAPTGRAAKRLSESTNSEASTIHRALEIDFTNQNMFFYNNNNKLPYDVIIIDEVSMVDIQLFYYLLRAIKRGTKIILVGDKDQLPSVGAGNVLGDILASGVINVVALTQIYRQSEDSLIITNAHLINSGKMPVINNKSQDFFFYEETNPQTVLEQLLQMQHKRIPEFLDIDPSKIQILAPMKAGVCGIDNLNYELQLKNNPPSFSKPEITTDKVTYRVGDRVMQITNNYEREWRRDFESGTGVFNGDIGTVLAINKNELDLTVAFEDGRVAIYNKADISELQLSYAITIHKSQGSEFDVVILPITSGPPMLLTKNLLYTAVTRAKKMVVIIGNIQTVRRMVKNNYTTTRYTLLKNMLIKTFNDYSKNVLNN